MAPERFHVARTAAEREQHRRMRDDLANYDGVTVFIAVDPDDPEGLAATVDIGRRAPCFLCVAQALRDIADRLEIEHDEGLSPCSR